MEATEKRGLFKELIRRRVFQITGIYLGAILALMEFTDMVVERYNLSDVTVDIVLAGMSSMIPAVILLAWRFGAPGKDTWSKTEKVAVPLNLIVAIGLIFSLTSNKQVGTVVETVKSVDETGQTVVREIPKLEYINRVQIFFIDRGSNLPESDDWLSYGLPLIMQAELEQNPFISPFTLYANFNDGIFWQLKRAGFADGLKAPISLAKSIARDSNTDFFVRGKLDFQNGQYQLALDLFNTKAGKKVADLQLSHTDVFELVVGASEFIKTNMETQSAGDQLINYMSAAELLTAEAEAMKFYTLGLNEILFENDYEGAKQEIFKAIEIDPSFVAARMRVAQILMEEGKFAEANEQLSESSLHSYKLREEDRFLIKALQYSLKGEREEERKVYKIWTELHPNNTQPVNTLANNYLWAGNEIEPALALFKRSIEIDPNQNWLYARIALLYEVLNQFEEASNYYQQFAEREPNSYQPLVSLARIARIQGDLPTAREYLEKAMVLRTDMVTPVLTMADLDLREGKLDLAEKRHNEALLISRAARQESIVIEHLIEYYYQQGQPIKAFELLRELQKQLIEFEDPLNAMFRSKLTHMYLYVEAGEADAALIELDELAPTMQAPFDQLVSVGYLFYFIALGDVEQAEQHYQAVDNLLKDNNMAHLYHISAFARGLIHDVKLEHEEAAKEFKTAIKLYEASVNRVNDDQLYEFTNYYLIRNLRLAEKYEEALKTAEKVIKQWPYHSLINLELAETHLMMQNNSAAAKVIERSLKMWENAEENYSAKGRALEIQELVGK